MPPWNPDELFPKSGPPKLKPLPAAGGMSAEDLFKSANPDRRINYNDPTNGMSALDLERAGYGKWLSESGSGIRQLGVDVLRQSNCIGVVGEPQSSFDTIRCHVNIDRIFAVGIGQGDRLGCGGRVCKNHFSQDREYPVAAGIRPGKHILLREHVEPVSGIINWP